MAAQSDPNGRILPHARIPDNANLARSTPSPESLDAPLDPVSYVFVVAT